MIELKASDSYQTIKQLQAAIPADNHPLQKMTPKEVVDRLLAWGQSPEIIQQVARRELHPAMLAHGLWKNEEDLANLADEIRELRAQDVERELPNYEDIR